MLVMKRIGVILRELSKDLLFCNCLDFWIGLQLISHIIMSTIYLREFLIIDCVTVMRPTQVSSGVSTDFIYLKWRQMLLFILWDRERCKLVAVGDLG